MNKHADMVPQDVCVDKILCNTGYCALHYVIAFWSVICMRNERHLRNRKRQIKNLNYKFFHLNIRTKLNVQCKLASSNRLTIKWWWNSLLLNTFFLWSYQCTGHVETISIKLTFRYQFSPSSVHWLAGCDEVRCLKPRRRIQKKFRSLSVTQNSLKITHFNSGVSMRTRLFSSTLYSRRCICVAA